MRHPRSSTAAPSRSFQPSLDVPRDLADHLRLANRCPDAIPLYQHALRYAPDLNEARASYIACLMYEGRYSDAQAQARIGLALERGGADSTNFRNFRAAAEKAILDNAAKPVPSA